MPSKSKVGKSKQKGSISDRKAAPPVAAPAVLVSEDREDATEGGRGDGGFLS